MAIRTVFKLDSDNNFNKSDIDFIWKSNSNKYEMSKQNVLELHNEIKNKYQNCNILEISSASNNELGKSLSAFNLTLTTKNGKQISVESLFQASKVFEKGGPYVDILNKSSVEAKKDYRLKTSGNVIGFRLFNKDYNINPQTLFYNWIYINTLNTHSELCEELMDYNAFTDIMFNSKYSLNCQAEACSIYVSLRKQGLLNKALSSIVEFEKLVYQK